MHDSYDTSTYIEPTNCKTNDCFNSLISIYLWARVLKYLNIGTMALPHSVSVNKCKLYAIPHTYSEVFSTRNQTEQWRHFNYVPQLKDALIIIIYIIFWLLVGNSLRISGSTGTGELGMCWFHQFATVGGWCRRGRPLRSEFFLSRSRAVVFFLAFQPHRKRPLQPSIIGS